MPSARACAVSAPIIPQVADWIRTHPGTLSLGQGVAGYPPPSEVWQEVERLRSEPLMNRYQPVGGLPQLIDSLEDKLRVCNGMPATPDRSVMVTAGANAAFQQVILAICDPGDDVILPLPWYFNQEMALTLASVRAVAVRSNDRYLPDVNAIRQAITSRTRAVVTVSPNNPTGAVYSRDCLQEINDLCRERGLFHISDETYEAFTFDGARHVSPGGFPGATSHTVSLFSFSKAYGLASWRIGYVAFPTVLLDSMRKIQDTLLICPPVVSQFAALGCLKAGESWLAGRMNEVRKTRERVLEGLRGLEPMATIGPADGAFYVFLRLNYSGDVMELTRRLIAEHGVAVIPGTAFGLTKDPCLRVAYGALTPDTAKDGVGRLVRGLRHLVR